MSERDPLTVLAAELPKVAAAVKKLDHPLLEMLIGKAQAEFALLEQTSTPANHSEGQTNSSRPRGLIVSS